MRIYDVYGDIWLLEYIQIKRLKRAGHVKDRRLSQSKEYFRRKFRRKKASRKTT
jgi:hypothetical protein